MNNKSDPPSIETSASAQRHEAADIGNVRFSITSEDKKMSQVALDATAAKFTAVLATINKQFGDDVKITQNNTSITMRHIYPDGSRTAPVFSHYEAVLVAVVETESVDRIGTLVASIASVFGVEIGDVSFKLSEPRKLALTQQAIAAASHGAMTKAKAMADAIGVSLGNVRRVSEGTRDSGGSTRSYYAYERVAARSADHSSDNDISMTPNQITVTVDITLVYDIVQ